MATMSDDQVNHVIDELEEALQSEDPAFVRRFHGIRRADAATAIVMVTLLASGAVLMAVGLATLSWIAWCAGAVALLAAVAVDGHHKRVLQRSPARQDGHATRLGRQLWERSGAVLAAVARRLPGPGRTWPGRSRRRDGQGWDQRILLGSTLAEVSAHIRGPDDLAGWFPGVRRVHHDAGTDILVGERGTRLRVLAERWIPGAGGTLRAAVDGAIITAHTTMRTVLAPAHHAGTVKAGVEIWVHAESDSRRGHRVLQRLRSVTAAGLRHMEAELSRT